LTKEIIVDDKLVTLQVGHFPVAKWQRCQLYWRMAAVSRSIWL